MAAPDGKPKREDNSVHTQFKQGNELWKLVKNPGRKLNYATPKKLWDKCQGYFQWIADNPIQERKIFPYKGKVGSTIVNHMHAMTMQGLCVYLNISLQNWQEYKARPGFSDICYMVESIIVEQKLSGAAAGLLNPAIIARELGLGSDKKDLEDMKELMAELFKHLSGKLPV